LETSPIRQAFYAISDGLEAGEPIKETMKDASKVLFG